MNSIKKYLWIVCICVVLIELGAGEEDVNLDRMNMLSIPQGRIKSWTECYEEPASENVTITNVQGKFINVHGNVLGLEVDIQGRFNQVFNQGRFTFEFWQEATGDKLKYSGSNSSIYDLCAHPLTNKESRDQNSSCPIDIGSEFTKTVRRPLFRNEVGNHEAKFVIIEDQFRFNKTIEVELACVIIPFELQEGQEGVVVGPERDRVNLSDEIRMNMLERILDEKKQEAELKQDILLLPTP
eukprot:TRINITY_DN24293_c0_g1_i1.p1 TRINITY_DN24293_c0_g1~~TRINITY_DN24293_c0_g1_i1.p1  ORF type:complete len:240 (+),score=59.87 TRINITY_DN24293_c0_g1_i1:97-816(+)